MTTHSIHLSVPSFFLHFGNALLPLAIRAFVALFRFAQYGLWLRLCARFTARIRLRSAAIAVGNTPRYTYGAIIPYRTGYTERFAIPRLPLTMNRHGNNLFIVYFSMTSRGTGDSRLNMVIIAQRAHGVRCAMT